MRGKLISCVLEKPARTEKSSSSHFGRRIFWHCPVLFGIPGRSAGEHPCAVAFDDPSSHKPQPFALEPGMTVVLHPYPYSIDCTKGVEISDTWLITEGEPRCLHEYPRRLTII